MNSSCLNAHQIRARFNRIAGVYDETSRFHKEIADRLLTHLEIIRLNPSYILDLGTGTGYLAQAVKDKYPAAWCMALDFAEAMLSQAKQRKSINSYVCAEARKLPLADHSMDLVISGLMLPWCYPLEEIFTQVQRVLKPGGLFLFSTLGPDTLSEIRASWASVDEDPHVHLFFDIHDLGDLLIQQQFSEPILQVEWLTWMFDDVNQLFSNLKKAGARNMWINRNPYLTAKFKFEQFLKAYQACQNAGQWPASFEIIYGHCWKNAVTRQKSSEYSVPVEAIKRAF